MNRQRSSLVLHLSLADACEVKEERGGGGEFAQSDEAAMKRRILSFPLPFAHLHLPCPSLRCTTAMQKAKAMTH